MSVDRPVALVTGASRGIGRHLAGHLLANGYAVTGCSRGPAGWEATGYSHHEVDVTDESQVVAMLRRIARDHGRLDALVNCAGCASLNHALLTPGATLSHLLATNVVGTFAVSREAVKLMRRRRFGRIVNMSSVAVPLRLAGQAAYVASKAAVESLSQVLAREVAAHGVTVNVLGAGPVDTDMTRGVPRETLEGLVASFPVARLSTLEDIAGAVDFFLKPGSDAVTGQVLYLGGVFG